MNIEKQVSNKDLSLKLKELGVPQKSVWYWYEIQTGYGLTAWTLKTVAELADLGFDEFNRGISAYTVAELFERMPAYLTVLERLCRLTLEKHNDVYVCGYPHTQEDGWLAESQEDENPANAVAKVFIWLIEEGHVKVEDL